MRRALPSLLIAACVAALPTRASAHDIPFDVTIQTYVKPDGPRLHVVVRAPLVAMRDIDYPTKGAGLLDLSRADAVLRDAAALWLVDNIAVYEGEERLPSPRLIAVQASVAGDRSFTSYDEALAHVTGPPLDPRTEFVWNQGLIDVLLEYPIQSDRSRFSIHPAFARLGLRVATILRFVASGGPVRAFELTGDPGLVRLDPSWRQASMTFVRLGFFHIFDGTDHLLFLFCLVIPFRRFRALIPVVTSFTVAHSLTLIASAYDLAPDALWFPPLIETLIAASIVYMALENIVFAADAASAPAASLRRRWMITFAFGLVHGFGFSFALRQTLQFAGAHMLASLLSFNVGVELGQLLVLGVMIPALYVLFRFVVAERIGTIILSALVAHTGWHWMVDRADKLAQYRIEWPSITPELLLVIVRAVMVIVTVAGGWWLVAGAWRSRSATKARKHETIV